MDEFEKVVLKNIGQKNKTYIKQKNYFDTPIFFTSISNEVIAAVMLMFFSEVVASYIILLACSSSPHTLITSSFILGQIFWASYKKINSKRIYRKRELGFIFFCKIQVCLFAFFNISEPSE